MEIPEEKRKSQMEDKRHFRNKPTVWQQSTLWQLPEEGRRPLGVKTRSDTRAPVRNDGRHKAHMQHVASFRRILLQLSFSAG